MVGGGGGVRRGEEHVDEGVLKYDWAGGGAGTKSEMVGSWRDPRYLSKPFKNYE